ncbi:hypothetical protein [Limnohabitans sp. Hippo3]|uniref:hypothetical protein n=1 Tax=Limnohabitans sp. Hippo3 TaxID=1597956 RepID=UPI000D3B4665|nr:hypothetical protein [Limnohabitans sp. Hippo3]PUE43866.1 hypothetical protein B9Z34_03375 [Limnohabitans sp. Hippo3]
MDSFSIWHWLIVIAVVLVVLLAGNLVANKSGALVVKKFFKSSLPAPAHVMTVFTSKSSADKVA